MPERIEAGSSHSNSRLPTILTAGAFVILLGTTTTVLWDKWRHLPPISSPVSSPATASVSSTPVFSPSARASAVEKAISTPIIEKPAISAGFLAFMQRPDIRAWGLQTKGYITLIELAEEIDGTVGENGAALRFLPFKSDNTLDQERIWPQGNSIVSWRKMIAVSDGPFDDKPLTGSLTDKKAFLHQVKQLWMLEIVYDRGTKSAPGDCMAIVDPGTQAIVVDMHLPSSIRTPAIQRWNPAA